MLFDCGGLEFTGCQFSGWYMSTEIVRDLSDLSRYNILKVRILYDFLYVSKKDKSCRGNQKYVILLKVV